MPCVQIADGHANGGSGAYGGEQVLGLLAFSGLPWDARDRERLEVQTAVLDGDVFFDVRLNGFGPADSSVELLTGCVAHQYSRLSSRVPRWV